MRLADSIKYFSILTCIYHWDFEDLKQSNYAYFPFRFQTLLFPGGKKGFLEYRLWIVDAPVCRQAYFYFLYMQFLLKTEHILTHE